MVKASVCTGCQMVMNYVCFLALSMPAEPIMTLDSLHERNRRVELDKAWETSKTRMIAIMAMTYVVATVFLWLIHVDRPYVSSLMPVIGYALSTASLPFVKKWWMRKIYS